MLKKTNYKSLIISIIIPIIGGIIASLLGGSTSEFATINKPAFSPPAILFPIVWTILYTLMGISTYILKQNNQFDSLNKLIYYTQLIVNILWPLFFFRLNWYLFSFFWIILLIVLVIIMIISFYKSNKTAGYLQMPYLIWITFAAILTLSIYLLNR